MANSRTFSVRPEQGGRLITTMSSDNVGVGNYLVKTNWRRFEDREILREGDLEFHPVPDSGDSLTEQWLGLDGVEILGAWEALRPNNERAIVVASPTDIYRFNPGTKDWDIIGSGYSPSTVEWQGEQLDGYLILNNKIDLPCTFRVEDNAVSPIYEMREIGIACVGFISVFNGFLMCSDISEIQADEHVGIMLSGDPYGRVSPSFLNRIRYQFEWCDFDDPRNFSPVIKGVIAAGDLNHVTLDFPCPVTFAVGTKLAVIGAGPGGTTLGGQFGIEDGVPVTAVAGRVLTLAVSADATLTYPLNVSVTRFADTSTFSGSSTIKDDSSSVICHRPLKQVLIVYRDTGIWIGRYTGVVTAPFKFTPAYRGAIVPDFPRCVIDVEGDYHLYPSSNGFYSFDGAGNPRRHSATDDLAKMFFSGITAENASRVFASHNPITSEVWFHTINGVVAYDYFYKTSSWIDQAYSAACAVVNPTTGEDWFVVCRSGKVLQYGATNAGAITFQRLGVPVQHVIKHGEVFLDNDSDEKDLLAYLPLFGEISNPVDVTLYGRDNVASPADLLFTETLTDAALKPQIETFFRNIYFQDEIRYTSINNSPVSFLGSSFTFEKVKSGGATRNDNGNS